LLCNPQPGTTWWDACAGGGGKTLHLSALMENRGLIWASDREEWRLKKLRQRAARAKCFNYRAALWDGGAKLPTRTKFDGVLLDAPCSGVGTWGRNPHARWTATAGDVRELAAVQRRLLTHAAPSVKPGGKLLYAVCTLTREETGGVVEWFNSNMAGFDPLPLKLQVGRVTPCAPLPGRSDEGAPAITWWPQETGGNGMFVAAWRRRS
jgi:16S rRNA (cytosine967-C5)-methyltransferase